MQFKINTKYIIPIIAVFMLLITLKRIFLQPEPKALQTLQQPISANFVKKIAGLGIVEPISQNIGISPVVPGVIKQICVQAGQNVKAGQTLFTLDASLLEAQIQTAKLNLEQAKHQLSFYQNAKSAISKQDLMNKEFDVKIAQSKLNELITNLELTNIKAPIDATILKVNTHIGEYAPTNILSKPLIVLADQSLMCVRVEIDQIDVQKLKYQKSAVGSLRSSAELINLTFVRSESILTPKRTLVNDGTERVDSRILEVIYCFSNHELNAISGQQMDVFIELSNDAK